MDPSTEEFYDSFSGEYTDSILRCVPRYQEMLFKLFDYLPDNAAPKRILELGSGTGNLTEQIRRRFPGAELKATDLSEACLNGCKERLKDGNIQYIKSDFMDLDFPGETFDLVFSSIAIHHLRDPDKEVLLNRIHAWLHPRGRLVFCDQFRGETEPIYLRHIERWKEYALKQGAPQKEWELWMEHQKIHDFHSPLKRHMAWMEKVGFQGVDCLWRNLLWAVLQGSK